MENILDQYNDDDEYEKDEDERVSDNGETQSPPATLTLKSACSSTSRPVFAFYKPHCSEEINDDSVSCDEETNSTHAVQKSSSSTQIFDLFKPRGSTVTNSTASKKVYK